MDISNAALYEKMVKARELQKDPKQAWSAASFQNSDLYKEVRRRAKSDLYFLAKYLIGYDGRENELILEKVHRRICDIFVQKNDSKPFKEQDDRKERMILYPRGCFKSTLNGIDAVQWILNFPNVRILFLTADKGLAEEFLVGLKSRFTIKSPPSFVNLYFPEFCVADNSRGLGNVSSFTSPARTNAEIQEPTVTASSIESTLSGHHYDVLKADDVISNTNSSNEDLLAKLYKNFYINKKTLMPYGYMDIIGTRYHEMDLYGEILERNVGDIVHKKDESSNGIIPSWEFIENLDTGLQVVIGRAIVPKQGVSKEIKDLTEDECVLLFPEYLTFKKLRKEWHDNEAASEGQYNQNPRPQSTTTFDLPLLQRQTIDFTQIPLSGPHSVTWDFAFSKKKKRDYSTCSVARWNEKGQMFIMDIVRKRFNPTELARAVVQSVKDWRPYVLGIEKAGASHFLESSIISEALKTNIQEVIDVCTHIDWIIPDLQPDAKRTRMAALHPWMVDSRLFFAKNLPYLDILYKEFQVCLVSHHHDDIPDVISQQPRYAPRMQQMIIKKELSTYSTEDASFNLLFEPGTDAFGRIGAVTPIPITPIPVDRGPQAESAYDEAPAILGAGLFG